MGGDPFFGQSMFMLKVIYCLNNGIDSKEKWLTMCREDYFTMSVIHGIPWIESVLERVQKIKAKKVKILSISF
ncbi:ORF14 [White sturgeon adenovirus 1]|uniref:ORF14 n=1 Tax=White sturgeon adenovirus 1 TaxID=2580388 RepID=A0A4P8PIR8_9ADEN|nr:ORF14 [White sturgeon adenovirus 1]QCQ84188.1 ORF14 [White sturgeon adenovirus 1]